MDKDVDDFYKTRRLSLISSHPYKVWLPASVFHMKKITRVNVKKMLASDFEINLHVHAVDASCSFLLNPLEPGTNHTQVHYTTLVGPAVVATYNIMYGSPMYKSLR